MKKLIILLIPAFLISCVEEPDTAVENKLLHHKWVLQQQTAEFKDGSGEVYDSWMNDEIEDYLQFGENNVFASDGLFSVNEGDWYFLTAGGTYFLEYDKEYIHFNKGTNEQVYFPEIIFRIKEVTDEKLTLVFVEDQASFAETFRLWGYYTGRFEADQINALKNYEEGEDAGRNFGSYIGFYQNFTYEVHESHYDSFSRGYEQGWNEVFNNDGNDFNAGFQAGYEAGWEAGKLQAEDDMAINPERKLGTVEYTYEFLREN
jgi:hypothetical protein